MNEDEGVEADVIDETPLLDVIKPAAVDASATVIGAEIMTNGMVYDLPGPHNPGTTPTLTPTLPKSDPYLYITLSLTLCYDLSLFCYEQPNE